VSKDRLLEDIKTVISFIAIKIPTFRDRANFPELIFKLILTKLVRKRTQKKPQEIPIFNLIVVFF